ncbi:MAG: hypothetical protein IT582_09040, partial [Opitutaceae bacterium]|nr:hypothetical protein [Opitutaceae bacterium]
MTARRAKTSPTAVLLVAGLLSVSGLGWWWWQQGAMQKTTRQIEVLQREAISLAQAEPAPREEVARELERESAHRESELVSLKIRRFAWLKSEAQRLPVDRRAAYFDLVAYRQRLTALAKQAQVELNRDETFGYPAYLNEGPAEADITSVFQQRIGLEQVLSSLLRCHPLALLEVERLPEPVVAETQQGRKFGSNHSLPTALALRRGGVLSTQRFAVRFTGRTETLRSWLNALAVADLPVVARNVSVQPADQGPTRTPIAKPGVV